MLLDSTPPPIRLIFRVTAHLVGWNGSEVEALSTSPATSAPAPVGLSVRQTPGRGWVVVLGMSPYTNTSDGATTCVWCGRANGWSCPGCWDVRHNGVDPMLCHTFADVHCQPTAWASALFWGNCPQQIIWDQKCTCSYSENGSWKH